MEFSSICVDPSADAQRNTTFPLYSRASLVMASMIRTPDALPVLASYITLCAIASVTMVNLPVRSAAGSVAAWLEK